MAQRDRRGNNRPDPDALLAAYRKEGAGKLKVFLGAAPGVGKTFAMLQGARRLKNDGVDVVIGLVETHSRDVFGDEKILSLETTVGMDDCDVGMVEPRKRERLLAEPPPLFRPSSRLQALRSSNPWRVDRGT